MDINPWRARNWDVCRLLMFPMLVIPTIGSTVSCRTSSSGASAARFGSDKPFNSCQYAVQRGENNQNQSYHSCNSSLKSETIRPTPY
jgi:hypothetical protein